LEGRGGLPGMIGIIRALESDRSRGGSKGPPSRTIGWQTGRTGLCRGKLPKRWQGGRGVSQPFCSGGEGQKGLGPPVPPMDHTEKEKGKKKAESGVEGGWTINGQSSS